MSYSLFDVDWNSVERNIPSYNGFSFSFNGFDNPSRPKLHMVNERTIMASIYNRIATDVSAIPLKHVRTNQNGRYKEDIDSGLNQCLNVEANIDQTGRELIFDATMSMFDEGVVALVPTESIINFRDPTAENAYNILSIRVGKIEAWQPRKVQVSVYNDDTGVSESLLLDKSQIAIIQNPFLEVMNQKGSMARRLVEKMNQSDMIDSKNANAKLDMVLQIPYNIKGGAKKKWAKDRIESLTQQMVDSEYGIGAIGETEKIVQLNRSIENNMLKNVEWLTNLLFGQLGVAKSVFEGTATEEENLNYYNKTIEPILSAFANEIRRKFLTKTARSQHQDIMYFRDPFKLVSVDKIAEIGDKFTRNEISSSNEMRSAVGLPPVDDPRADELRNKNLNQAREDTVSQENDLGIQEESGYQEYVDEPSIEQQISDIDDMLGQLDEMEADLDEDEDEEIKHYASPYYDPVKAHEYYEEHKKLKGRRSTSSLNDKGKEAAKYVKQQLDEERKAKDEKSKSEHKTNVETRKAAMQKSINDLNNQIKAMTAKQKKSKRHAIKAQIATLRAQFKEEKERLTAQYKEEKQRRKTEYEEKYIQELDAMRSEGSFVKPVKRKKKKS